MNENPDLIRYVVDGGDRNGPGRIWSRQGEGHGYGDGLGGQERGVFLAGSIDQTLRSWL